jgi:hypothetical protein
MSRTGVVDIVLAEHGRERVELLERAQSRFPYALLTPDDGAHGGWAAAAIARIDGASCYFCAPVDLNQSAGRPLEAMRV